MIYPLLPVFLTATLGASPAILGMIEGAADGLASILKYFAGALSDRAGRRKQFIVSGYALAAASRAIIAAAKAWPLVLFARLLDRTGKGARSAPRDALISDVTPPDQRGRAFGFHRAMDHSGAILGPLLAMGLLALGMTTRGVFYMAVIPGALGAVLLVFLLRERSATKSEASPHTSSSFIPQTASFKNAIFAISLFSLSNSSDAFLLLQAHRAGVSTTMLPALWAAHHIIKALFTTAAGSLSDRIDRRYLLIVGWTFYAALYVIFPFAETLSMFVILFVLYAIPFTLTEGAERAWIADLVPAEARGKSFGVYYLANGLCVLAGTALFGVLYQTWSPRAAFFTGASFALAAVLVVVFTRVGQRSRVNV